MYNAPSLPHTDRFRFRCHFFAHTLVLSELGVIKSDAVGKAFEAVDRGAFLPPALIDQVQ